MSDSKQPRRVDTEAATAAFERAVFAAPAGTLCPVLVETEFGFHIIQRLPYSEVAKDYNAQYSQSAGHATDHSRMPIRSRAVHGLA